MTRRLGLIPARASREQAHEILERLVPSELYYPLHLNLIAHGRAVCQARRPRCEVCVIREKCEYYRRTLRGEPQESVSAREELPEGRE